MVDEVERLDEMEQLNERNIHANKLFHSFLSVHTDLTPDRFNALLLYFVTYLIQTACKSDETDVERIFVRRTVADVVEGMTGLIKYHSNGLAAREGLIEALSENVLTQLMDQFQYLEPRIFRKTGFARRVFDVMLRRVLTEDYQISLFHSHVVALLAVSLCKTNTRLIETYPYSGAASVTAQVLKKDVETLYRELHGCPYKHQDLISLRLKVRGLSSQPLAEVETNDMTLLDGAQLLEPQNSVFATLEQLIKQGALSDSLLVIVDRDQSRALPDTLRAHFEEHNLLEAVIDLPSKDAFENGTEFTAWLLNTDKDRENAGETLCINATRMQEDAGYFELAGVSAAIVKRWRSSHYKIDERFLKESFDSPLVPEVLNHFKHHYRNLPGLCRVFPIETVLRATEITARQHLMFEAFDLKLYRPESSFLRDILIGPKTVPSCIYIIGNNGTGKSLLLRDLIDDLGQAKLNSVGIAFGAIDRFPVESSEAPLFEYQGARRHLDDPFQLDWLHGLGQALYAIYQEPYRLNIFNEALQLLDFKHRHYLVPVSDPHNPITDWERGISSFELYEGVTVSTGDRLYEPGLLQKEGHPVAPFSDLSSGEQQVLSLLIKVCAKANSHTVFLIDEPEISLHVSWQQQLPSLLSLVAEAFGCSLVIATHSPLIIANARDAISHCFLTKDRLLIPIPAHQRHSVESILLDGFKTYTPDNSEVSERCAVLVSRAIQVTNSPGKVDHRQKKKLIQTLKTLRDTLEKTAGAQRNQRYQQDLTLIEQAQAAINELFERAKKDKQQ
ncbi:ATP-binding protein [Pseudomonas sp. Xaverov 259]|uniref:AAA family ATPase n=1 Tax=Pseudomonas sp. Xaverov 259 TaxID=2666086 RepID=UPI00214B3162|nr:ATP-binding protein [Pseudomonas sp. Xaverov 259]